MRENYSPLMRITAAVVLITFTMLILEPAAVAAQVLHQEYQEGKAQAARSEAAKLSKTLEIVESTLSQWQEDFSADSLQSSQTLKQQVLTMDEHVQADFEAIAEHISHQNLPAEIMQRHTEAVARYRSEMDTLLNNLDAIDAATDNEQRRTSIEKALNHLKPLQNQGKHAPFDPNQLPFNIPKGEVRPPIEDEKELKKRFSATKQVKVATTTLLPDMLKVAQAPDSTDLDPTEDVQVTPEIEALASELEHNPVKIYNWVHDNIQFIPTYGSIQGSQMTLETKSGNAFDTASLLIALLRTSGIHARYAYGTVRIPINQAMNWVGGVTSPEAAMQLFAQGGIPTAGLAQGGSIKFLKLEHIWVEAWIDFFPSRGAIHKTGDSWVPMDASFKQYQFTEGMDIQGNVPFDAEGFVDQIVNTAQINEDEGWVSGIDQTFMETTLQNYQTQMEAYINDTNPDATVGEVLGTQNIIPSNRPILAGSLPYPVMAKAGFFQEIPSNLRKEFQFNLYASDMDRMLENPVFSLKKSLPDLAGKRLTLSFEPASDADRQVIESYLPEVPEGEELDPNDLPSSLPGYLINLKAQFKIDGEIVAESSGFRMGQELSSTTGISRLTGDWHLATNKPIAGEFYAFGIDLQGINDQYLHTGQDGTLGGILHKAALLYFHALDANLKSVNRTKQAIGYRQPSFGTFSTNFTPQYRFGIPQRVSMSGILIDMDVVTQTLWTTNNDAQLNQVIGKQIGMMSSALEHKIPELFFTNQEYFGEAVSAVKALSIAGAEGQRIYTLTETNIDSILPLLNVGNEVKDDIRASVAVGKQVTVSPNPVNVGNWLGVGYIITAPETGAGAYRISGGDNGGSLNFQLDVNGLLGIWVALGLETLVPIWKEIFKYLKCYDKFVRDILLWALIGLTIAIIIALIGRGPVFGPVVIAFVLPTLLMIESQMAYAAGSSGNQECPALELVSVHFMAANDPQKFLPIWKDEIGKITEIKTTEPQWKDDKSQPLGYVGGAKLKMKAVFKVVTPPKQPGIATIRAKVKIGNRTQNQQATIPDFSTKSFALSTTNNEEKTVTMTAKVPFKSNLTQFFNPMKIDWDFSFKRKTYDIEVSRHPVYVTLKQPLTNPFYKIYLTSLHLAVSNPGATGTSVGKAKKQAIHKTWTLFQTKSIRNWENQRLYYYKYGHGFADLACNNLGDLLTTGKGQCDTFAKLFRAALAANGIDSDQVMISTKNGDSALTKNWSYPATDPTFTNSGAYQWKLILIEEAENEYGMVPPNQNNRYGDLTSKTGIAGQNSPTPSEKIFGRHFIVKITDSEAVHDGGLTTFYYDPSYGVTYAGDKIGAEVNFENQAVDGYFKYFDEDAPDENPGEGHFRVRRSNGMNNILFSQ